MPPRFAYWTIIAGGLPTAFRAAERDELLPTFTRLKEKQPDAEMKWFARGKLWASPEDARNQRERGYPAHRGAVRRPGDNRDGGRSDRGESQGDRPRESRGRDWRPGGEHRDPRQQFKDAKKARNQRFKAAKFERKSGHRDQAATARPNGARRDQSPAERRPREEGYVDRDRREGARTPPRDARPGRKPWAPKEPRGASERPWQQKPRGQDRDTRPRRPDWRDDSSRPKPPADRPTGPAQAHGDRDRHPSAKHRSPDDRGWSRPKPHSEGDRNWTRPKPPGEQHRNWSQPKQRSDQDRNRPQPKPHQEKDSFRSQPKRQAEGRGTYRGGGHGDNSWKPRPPRDDRNEPRRPREFSARGFERDRPRSGGTEEPTPPPKPRGPNREPRPSEEPRPSAPPRPGEPVITPPGPPERGRLNKNKRTR